MWKCLHLKKHNNVSIYTHIVINVLLLAFIISLYLYNKLFIIYIYGYIYNILNMINLYTDIIHKIVI